MCRGTSFYCELRGVSSHTLILRVSDKLSPILIPHKFHVSTQLQPGVAYGSDFQPVFRGKLVFRERSSGVPQEI